MWQKEYNQRLEVKERQKQKKLEVLSHYSDGKLECACCGEDVYEFLSIDHIGGGGNAHRKALKRGGYSFYYWLKKNGYPPGFRVLCYNCNLARGFYGYCPHEKKKLVTVFPIEDNLVELGMQCARELEPIRIVSEEMNNLF